jgi:sigma-B regulation protein RsbU (phosphoserine phosphatase)
MNQPPSPNRHVYLLECLHEAASMLRRDRSEVELARSLVLSAMGTAGATRGALLLKRDARVEVVAASGQTWSEGLLPLGRLSPAAIPDHIIDIGDLPPSELRTLLTEGGLTSAFPLQAGDRILGLLALALPLSGHALDADARHFLRSLTIFYAISIHDAQERQNLESTNRVLDRRNRALESLFEVGQRFSSTLDEAEILDLLAFSLMGNLTLTRVSVLFPQAEGWQAVAQKGRPISAGFLDTIPQPGAWCKNATPPPEIIRKLRSEGLGALIPATAPSGLCALIAVGPPPTGRPLDREDQRLIATFASVAMGAVESTRLFQDTLARQRLEKELAIARAIQEGLCPQRLPQIPGLEVAAMTRPSKEVGGDLFEAVLLDDGSALFAVADVTGKSVSAALLAASIQAAIRTLCRTGIPLQELVKRVNELVCEQTDAGRFATCFFAHYDPRQQMLTTCSAGHDPPLLFGADGQMQSLSTGGLLLGVLPRADYEIESRPFTNGACLAIYTDGLTEAQAPVADPEMDGDELGLERLGQLIEEARNETLLASCAERILEAVDAFTEGSPPTDDRTLLLLRATHALR